MYNRSAKFLRRYLHEIASYAGSGLMCFILSLFVSMFTVQKHTTMKKLITISMLILPFMLQAQTGGNILGKYYIANLETKVLLCDFATVEVPVVYEDPASHAATIKLAKKDTKFTVVGFATRNSISYAVIKPWKFPSNGKGQVPNKTPLEKLRSFTEHAHETPFIDSSANELYFAISMEDLSSHCSEFHGRAKKFTYGIVTMPYKMRFGNGKDKFFQFSSNYNIGGTAGIRFALPSRTVQSVSILGGVSLSSFEVDSSSTHGYQLNKLTAAALTPLAGIVYEYERYQVGVMFGWDFLPGELGRKWLYQGNTFMAVGIGVALFQPSKADEQTNANGNK